MRGYGLRVRVARWLNPRGEKSNGQRQTPDPAKTLPVTIDGFGCSRIEYRDQHGGIIDMRFDPLKDWSDEYGEQVRGDLHRFLRDSLIGPGR